MQGLAFPGGGPSLACWAWPSPWHSQASLLGVKGTRGAALAWPQMLTLSCFDFPALKNRDISFLLATHRDLALLDQGLVVVRTEMKPVASSDHRN